LLTLVENGLPKSDIVIGEDAPHSAEIAARDLQQHIRLATSVVLPLVKADSNPPADGSRIVVGSGSLSRSLGLDATALESEEYVIETKPPYLLFIGRDPEIDEREARVGVPTVWAVAHFLDAYLGVRWLWPGEAGTYVPRRASINVPEIDIRARPRLEMRLLYTLFPRREEDTRPMLEGRKAQQFRDEAALWLEHHMLGSRSPLKFAHCFSHWWDKYHEEHPDLFAVPAPGFQQPYPMKERVKLNLGNPAVIDRIMAEWQEAGAPDSWCVGPNDGAGFCVGDASRAMDDPPNQPIMDIWEGRAKLGTRYVRFWNQLLRRMKETNPRAKLSSFAYHGYRDPPTKVRAEEGLHLAIVHSYDAYEEWMSWIRAGAKMFLRPNWWHTGAIAPHLPLHRIGNYFKFAYENDMMGFAFDSLLGHWATQGPNYYLVARLSVRPELSVDQVIDEFCSAFGTASGVIRRYIEYWEEFTEKAKYPIHAGGALLQKGGLFEEATRRHGVTPSAIRGSWEAIPYLITEERLSEARKMLDEAKEKEDDPAVKDRIEFLEDGLRHLEATRDLLLVADEKTRPPGTTRQQIQRMFTDLQQMRRRMTERHVIWGDLLNWVEKHWKIKTSLESAAWTLETE